MHTYRNAAHAKSGIAFVFMHILPSDSYLDFIRHHILLGFLRRKVISVRLVIAIVVSECNADVLSWPYSTRPFSVPQGIE